jgi:HSP20 family protein
MWQLTPSLDLFENGESYWILMDIPGADASTLSVELIEQKLHVRAEQRPIHGASKDVEFKREIDLPMEIDADSVVADYENGVLDIKLQKARGSRAVTIPVN